MHWNGSHAQLETNRHLLDMFQTTRERVRGTLRFLLLLLKVNTRISRRCLLLFGSLPFFQCECGVYTMCACVRCGLPHVSYSFPLSLASSSLLVRYYFAPPAAFDSCGIGARSCNSRSVRKSRLSRLFLALPHFAKTRRAVFFRSREAFAALQYSE